MTPYKKFSLICTISEALHNIKEVEFAIAYGDVDDRNQIAHRLSHSVEILANLIKEYE